jgi:hypothetical protein
MNLSEIKHILSKLNTVVFQLPNKSFVPEHFHVTEVGVINKKFIDCGGTLREEKRVNFQLWEANDFDHRLAPSKLIDIISVLENTLNIDCNLEIEVEYQNETISKYNLDFNGSDFVLVSKQTACLALDACGIPQEKIKMNLSEITTQNSCKPGSGCC